VSLSDPSRGFRIPRPPASPVGLGTVEIPKPGANGSQFFIWRGDLKLPLQYTIFGEVVSGMEAVDAIAALPADAQDRPRREAVISKVSVATA
jgi:cyclophilin family peptidyl-prolyl cis-trans isomerase